jgi:phosphoribosyl 1,2-cyclic phosphodiesterase
MIRVRFWGTRGSIVSPGRATRRYGGNTPCVQVVGFQNGEPGAAMRPDNPHVILDGGTGLASLQTTLMGGAWGRGRGELHLLLSHYHWDHIIGIPFFGPLFVKGNRVVFYGASIKDLRSSIERLFTSVYSPLKGIQNVSADLEYRRMEPGGMELAGFQLRAAETRHPGTTLAFHIQYGPHVVIYSTDHEAGDLEADSRLVDLARGAHLWILDAPFTQEQRQRREGWGHSSHLEAIKLALEAGVETAVLFHHNSEHDDSTLDRMGLEAAKVAASTRTKVLMARDGMVVEVGDAPVSGRSGGAKGWHGGSGGR